MDTAVIAMNTAPLATGEPVFRFYDNRQKYLLTCTIRKRRGWCPIQWPPLLD